MYAAGVAGLCLSSSVAAFVMNREEDEVASPAEQPEETVEKEEVEGDGISPQNNLHLHHRRTEARANSLHLTVCVAHVLFGHMTVV